MDIELNKEYLSQLIANADLYGGGHLSVAIYRKCLRFLEDGSVVLTRKLFDPVPPKDESDILFIQTYHQKGRYHLNDKGYLICEFNDLDLTLTGQAITKDKNVFVFYASDKRLNNRWTELYALNWSDLTSSM